MGEEASAFAARAASDLWQVGLVDNEKIVEISSENQVKLERVYVRMSRHQEPTKDVAKLRKASGSRKQALIRGYPRFGNDTMDTVVSGR